MLKKSLSLTSRTRKFVIGLASAVTAAIGLSMTPQVTFAAVAITPSDYYANFNGSDQYVETGNAPIATAGDFTVEAWVYNSQTNLANTGTIISQGTNSTGNNFYLASTYNSNAIRVGDAWNPVYTGTSTSVTWPLNQWFHIAVTNGGTTQKLFINGQLVASTTGLDINPTATGLRIGRMYGTFNEYWKGKIDEVKIYNQDRSASIATDMVSRADVSSGNLLGYYDFNTGVDRLVGQAHIT